jgi:hypothetical protein
MTPALARLPVPTNAFRRWITSHKWQSSKDFAGNYPHNWNLSASSSIFEMR